MNMMNAHSPTIKFIDTLLQLYCSVPFQIREQLRNYQNTLLYGMEADISNYLENLQEKLDVRRKYQHSKEELNEQIYSWANNSYQLSKSNSDKENSMNLCNSHSNQSSCQPRTNTESSASKSKKMSSSKIKEEITKSQKKKKGISKNLESSYNKNHSMESLSHRNQSQQPIMPSLNHIYSTNELQVHSNHKNEELVANKTKNNKTLLKIVRKKPDRINSARCDSRHELLQTCSRQILELMQTNDSLLNFFGGEDPDLEHLQHLC